MQVTGHIIDMVHLAQDGAFQVMLYGHFTTQFTDDQRRFGVWWGTYNDVIIIHQGVQRQGRMMSRDQK
jgi:hypothetical protein